MGAMKNIATNRKLADLANGATAEPQVSTPAEIAAEEQFLAEAEQRIRTHEGAIGYAVYSRDWGCRHDFHIPLDNVVMLGDVRSR
jgi:hypothetical protein